MSNNDILKKLKDEIEQEYGGFDICEYREDYDWEERNISEYFCVGSISDVLDIIDRYIEKSKDE